MDNQAESSGDNLLKEHEAVHEAESRLGNNHIEVSFKLDELAAALKAKGRLLDAANATARAKAIRAEWYGKESSLQEEKTGSVHRTDKQLSAVGWLKNLYRTALVGTGAILLLFVLLPASMLGGQVVKEIVGSTCAASFLQLLLFRIKSMPLVIRLILIALGSGLIWILVGFW